MQHSFLKIAGVASLLAAIALLPSTAKSQDEIGPAVGATIENFSLTDQSGKTQEFGEMLKTGPVAVVFYRSANW